MSVHIYFLSDYPASDPYGVGCRNLLSTMARLKNAMYLARSDTMLLFIAKVTELQHTHALHCLGTFYDLVRCFGPHGPMELRFLLERYYMWPHSDEIIEILRNTGDTEPNAWLLTRMEEVD